MPFFQAETPQSYQIPPIVPSPLNIPPVSSTKAQTANRQPPLNPLARPEIRTDKKPNFTAEVKFISFNNFLISQKSVREICAEQAAKSVDIHMLSLVNQKLPKIALTYLSPSDFLIDAVRLDMIHVSEGSNAFRIIPFYETLGRETNWSKYTMKKNHNLTITLDCSKFDKCKYKPSAWIGLKYSPYVSDFYLVIDIGREKSNDVSLLTTYGYLIKRCQAGPQIRSNNGGTSNRSDVASCVSSKITLSQLQGIALKDGECTICMEDDNGPVDTILYPCMHANVHKECLNESKICPTCRDREFTKMIDIKIVDKYCRFCGPPCKRFDSILLPCECIIGCHEGWSKNDEMCKVNSSCPNCSKRINDVKKFYPN